MNEIRNLFVEATNFDTLDEAADFLAKNDIYHHGIEDISCGNREARYINMGDTYDLTILEEDGNLFEGSWGGWFEEAETEYCEENEVIRCSYCGEFTPYDDPDTKWNEVICQHCDNPVGG